MYEHNKKAVRNRKILFLLTFLYGIITIWIGIVNFHSGYITVSGFIIAMLSSIFYALSELEWRFSKSIKDFRKGE